MKYKLFGKSGLRVSEICLGTMTFGQEWQLGAGYEDSKKVFDVFVNAGGNFIDTANRYTEGTSEKWVGEFIASDRDHFVLATKYTLYDRRDDPNFNGNHRKNLYRSVESSLKRLKTEYIDLLWLHMWDFTTSIEEVMRSLDDLISSGKVHYIGISDTPAWIVSRANALAELRGWHSFVGLQIEYSLIERTPERELLPMAKALDLAVTPWGVLGGGALTGKYLDDKTSIGRVSPDSKRRSEYALKIAKEVVSIAKELNRTPAEVAINWTRQRNQVIIPIVGARYEQQIKDWIRCVDFIIPDEFISKLDEVSKIDLGFPHEFFRNPNIKDVIFGGTQDKIIKHREF
ncbi:MAG: aldo/keto reductase [Ignavibacteria bacterium]|nr:aldo/keto reductase [Ignavibacteria bacterium]